MNKKAERLTTALLAAAQAAIPKEEKANKKWISQQTLQLIQEKRKLKLNRNKSEADEKMYRNKCNMVKKAAREDKVKWLEE